MIRWTFYSPDHPLTFTPDELWSSGLTTRGDLDKWGFIGICDTTDYYLAKCEAWMKQNAPDAEQLSITSRRYFHGKAGSGGAVEDMDQGTATSEIEDE